MYPMKATGAARISGQGVAATRTARPRIGSGGAGDAERHRQQQQREPIGDADERLSGLCDLAKLSFERRPVLFLRGRQLQTGLQRGNARIRKRRAIVCGQLMGFLCLLGWRRCHRKPEAEP